MCLDELSIKIDKIVGGLWITYGYLFIAKISNTYPQITDKLNTPLQ